MKIYQSIEEFSPDFRPVLTIGTFDGVHSGHRKIIGRLIESARETGGESVILTFFPHPRTILNPENKDLKLIHTLEEKAEILNKLGISHLIIHPFTREFSELSGEEFIKNVIVDRIKAKTIVIGYNHQFGKNREGTFEQLMRMSSVYDFAIEEIPAEDINNVAVSSTRIRKSLLEGNVKAASLLMGYDFELSGTVKQGDKIGRELGFPTANISVKEKYKLIPADGIYAVNALIRNEKFDGVMYIGKRPTLQRKKLSLEIHVFDFAEDIYEEKISVLFKDRIRGDIVFSGLDEMKKQIQKDAEKAKIILNH